MIFLSDFLCSALQPSRLHLVHEPDADPSLHGVRDFLLHSLGDIAAVDPHLVAHPEEVAAQVEGFLAFGFFVDELRDEQMRRDRQDVVCDERPADEAHLGGVELRIVTVRMTDIDSRAPRPGIIFKTRQTNQLRGAIMESIDNFS